MNCVKVDRKINQIITIFYGVGLWHKGENPTVKETGLKICFLIYYLLFPISMFVGAIENDNIDESIFLTESATIITVVLVKLIYIIWKKKQTLELLNQICVYDIDDREEFINVNDKLKRFMKIINIIFLVPTIFAVLCSILVVPFLGTKKLCFEIAFPFDWRNDELAYWLAFAFNFTEMILTMIAFPFSTIIWYVMINCCLKYETLGNQIKTMGVNKEIDATGTQRNTSKCGKNIFIGDLMEAIQFHRRIREYCCLMSLLNIDHFYILSREIQQMQSFFSPMFLVQLAVSSLCICQSIYIIIFSEFENAAQFIINTAMISYNIFEIFMVMYFGNEIKSSSDRLTYCLFESNWIDQSQSSLQLMIIFGEILQRPHVLLVSKIYSLTLQTFSRILNAAYSMLNFFVQYY